MNSLNLFLVVIGAASTLASPQYRPFPLAPQAQQYPAPSPVLVKAAPPQLIQYSAAPVVKSVAPAAVYAAPTIKAAAPQYVAAAPVIKAAAPQYASPAYSSQYVKPVAIVRQSQDDNFDGSFNYGFEAENGISSQAAGYLKAVSPKELGQVIQGSYSYPAPDGRLITTSYVADENGFQVQGDHLPVAPQEPELPPLIAKSLAYIRSLPPQPENQQ